MQTQPLVDQRWKLRELERRLKSAASDLAIFLVYDRPDRVEDRPDLERAFFAQRCVSDIQLTQMVEAFSSVGAYVELFEGEIPFMGALASGEIKSIDRPIKVVYNGIEGGVTSGGFEPGRNALIPAIADSYGLPCANSNAYGCAISRHKFHYLTILRALGIPTPATWQYRPSAGWSADQSPGRGTRVIVKSTHESWSVGVTDKSIFIVDDSCEERVRDLAMAIGQPVTVQEFIAGDEVCVPVLSYPHPVATPSLQAIINRAPGNPDAVMTIDDTLGLDGLSHRRLEVPSEVGEQLEGAATRAVDILGLGSFARIDFRLDSALRPWLIDVGTSPGVSDRSSAYRSFALLGLEHPEFLRVIVAANLAWRGML